MPDLHELAARRCRPRKGPGDAIDDAELERLLQLLPGWKREDGTLAKRFGFSDYYRTLAFVNALAFVAHGEDHHPDLEVGYDRCVVRWSTHDVGGLSENDLICAARTELLAAGAPA